MNNEQTEVTTPENDGKKSVVITKAGPSVGDMVQGTVVKLTGAVAFIDFGGRNEGYIELAEFSDAASALSIGDTIQSEVVSIRGGIKLSQRKIQNNEKFARLRTAMEQKSPVSGIISGTNKGGYEVRIDGIRAFCPNSQFSLNQANRDGKNVVGQSFEFQITEWTKKGGLVVSRRPLLEADRQRARASLSETVKSGDRLQGKVTQVKDFGIFVHLFDGVEGLIHQSEVSFNRNLKPADVVKVGDAIEVVVLRIDAETGRVGLSLKALEKDPWSDFAHAQEANQKVIGHVVRTADFGVFVQLKEGVEGLLHVSAIKANERLESCEGLFETGQEIEVIIESVDLAKRRISLVTPEVAESRRPLEVSFGVNTVLKGKVQKVERFGVILELEENVTGLIPNSELGTPRGTDHFRMFPVNTEIEVKVLEIDKKRRRISLSRKALLNHDEEQAFADYKKNAEVPKSLGSFGDLLSKHLKNS